MFYTSQLDQYFPFCAPCYWLLMIEFRHTYIYLALWQALQDLSRFWEWPQIRSMPQSLLWPASHPISLELARDLLCNKVAA